MYSFLSEFWADRIVYWVMSNEEVKANKFSSHQHRGGIEYQIGITNRNLEEFDLYKADAASVAGAVVRKGCKSCFSLLVFCVQ